MTANGHNSRRDDNAAGSAARHVRHARREFGPRSEAPRAWLPEGHGLDGPNPGVSTQSGTGVEHFHYERVTVEEARMAYDSTDVAAAPDNPSCSLPRSPPEPLGDGTIRWLAQLPETVRPLELAQLFPRIANKLCGLWANPALCNRYIAGLLMDSRDGGREGFPLRVAVELAALIAKMDTDVEDHPWSHVKALR